MKRRTCVQTEENAGYNDHNPAAVPHYVQPVYLLSWSARRRYEHGEGTHHESFASQRLRDVDDEPHEVEIALQRCLVYHHRGCVHGTPALRDGSDNGDRAQNEVLRSHRVIFASRSDHSDRHTANASMNMTELMHIIALSSLRDFPTRPMCSSFRVVTK